MRNLVRTAVWGLVAGGVALAADWLPDALAELDFFRAREYRVAGARLLQEQEVLAAAAISPFLVGDLQDGRRGSGPAGADGRQGHRRVLSGPG